MSHARPDATEILFDKTKITAYIRLPSPPRGAHTKIFVMGFRTLAGVISLDQLCNSSKACTCTIPEKPVSATKGDARAFFLKIKKESILAPDTGCSFYAFPQSPFAKGLLKGIQTRRTSSEEKEIAELPSVKRI